MYRSGVAQGIRHLNFRHAIGTRGHRPAMSNFVDDDLPYPFPFLFPLFNSFCRHTVYKFP